jgi:hypothetical protein
MARLKITSHRNGATVYTPIQSFLIIYKFYTSYPAHPKFSPKQLGMHEFKKRKDCFHPSKDHWEVQKSCELFTKKQGKERNE